MQTKTLLVLALSAFASAVPQDASAALSSASAAIASALSFISAAFGPTTSAPNLPPTSPPTSILSVLETAIPSTLIAQWLTDPVAESSYLSQVYAGSMPGWYQSLPSDVKTYLLTAYHTAATQTSSGASASSTITATATPIKAQSSSQTVSTVFSASTIFITTNSGASTSTFLTSTADDSNSPTPTPASSPTQASTKLGTGAIVGIALGSFAAVVFLVGIVIAIIRYKRRHSRNDSSNIPIDHNPDYTTPPTNAYASGGPGYPAQTKLPAGNPAPMGYAPTYQPAQQLPAQQRQISEMPGSVG